MHGSAEVYFLNLNSDMPSGDVKLMIMEAQNYFGKSSVTTKLDGVIKFCKQRRKQVCGLNIEKLVVRREKLFQGH